MKHDVTLSVTAKGQITLRKSLLDHLGAKPGDEVEVHPIPNGGLLLKNPLRRRKVRDVAGILHRPDIPVLSLEDIEEITQKAWAGER